MASAQSEEKKEELIKLDDKSEVTIRDMKESEMKETNKILQNAFYGLTKNPQVLEMMMIYGRRYVNEIYVVEYENKLIGVGIAVHWGSIRVWGPIGVLQNYQKNGIGKMIINHINNSLKTKDKHNKIKRDVLFTHINTHHVPFYMTIGMLPKYLSFITIYNINNRYDELIHGNNNNIIKQYENDYLFKDCLNKTNDGFKIYIAQCKTLTDFIYSGLDLSVEIEGYYKFNDIGTCVGLFNVTDDKLMAFGICSFGKLSEAPTNAMKIKFAAANDNNSLCLLLYNIIKYAKDNDLVKIEAGINVGRVNAFRIMTDFFGFEYDAQKPNISMGKTIDSKQEYDDYNCSNSYIVGDWR